MLEGNRMTESSILEKKLENVRSPQTKDENQPLLEEMKALRLEKNGNHWR